MPSQPLLGQELSPFQRFCIALQNVPQKGRFLGSMTMGGPQECSRSSDSVRLVNHPLDVVTVNTLKPLIEASLIACGGEVQFPATRVPNPVAPGKPHFKTPETRTVALHSPDDSWNPSHKFNSWIFAEEDVQRLKEVAREAPYGDLIQGETRVDKKVRSALEIPELHWSAEGKELSHIRSQVRAHLMGKDFVSFKAYKMNIYQKGDFFKPHVDTPPDGTMLGTLVVALPTPHTGGELIVRHHGYEAMFSFANSEDDPCVFSITPKLRWAAFYGDCEHEIRPIKSGTRITMTFLIKRETRKVEAPRHFGDDEEEEEEEENEEDYPPPLLALMNRRRRDEKGNLEAPQENVPTLPFPERMASLDGIVSSIVVGRIPNDQISKAGAKFLELLHSLRTQNRWMGIILSHRYTETGIQPANLKGLDRALYKLASEDKAVKVILLPVLIQEKYEFYDYENDEDSAPTPDAAEIYAFTPSDIAFLSCASTELAPLDCPVDGSIRFSSLDTDTDCITFFGILHSPEMTQIRATLMVNTWPRRS